MSTARAECRGIFCFVQDNTTHLYAPSSDMRDAGSRLCYRSGDHKKTRIEKETLTLETLNKDVIDHVRDFLPHDRFLKQTSKTFNSMMCPKKHKRCSARFTEEQLEAITTPSKRGLGTTLNLTNCLSGLNSFPELRKTMLGLCDRLNSAVECFTEELYLDGNSYNVAYFVPQLLVAAQTNPNPNPGLKTLSLRSCHIGHQPQILMMISSAFTTYNGTCKTLDLSGNGLGEVGGLGLRDALVFNKSLTSLDVSSNRIGPAGAKLLGEGIAKNASLTCCNVLSNGIGVEGARSLVEAVKDKNISLCGITSDETTVEFGGITPDAILLASDLSKARHTSLTSLNLRGNPICGRSANGTGTYTTDGIHAIADALRFGASLTKLDISFTFLGTEGVQALESALSGSNRCKLQDLRINNNVIDDGGEAAIAALCAAVPTLVRCNVLENHLDVSEARSLVHALRDRNISLSHIGMIEDVTVEGWQLEPPDAILLASDLTKARHAKLRSLDCSSNKLCGVDENGEGEYTVAGIQAIADALRVNTSLTSLSLSDNNIGDEGAKVLAAAGVASLTSLNVSDNNIGHLGAIALVDRAAASASLTELDLTGNSISVETANALREAVNGRDDLKLRLN